MISRTFRRLNFERCESRELLAVITVNSLADDLTPIDGRTTLRDAIVQANTMGPAESVTIVFEDGLAGGTVALAGGPLRIERSMSIDASTLSQRITIDGSDNDPTPNLDNGDGARIFTIDDGDMNYRSDVYLRNLAITGGDAMGDGGAVLTTEKLTVESMHLFNNASQGRGGGVAARCGTACAAVLVVEDSQFDSNSGQEGGAIYVGGSINVSDSAISNNTATRGGGAIYAVRNHASAANIAIRDSQIIGNTGGGAGGVFAYGQEGQASISIVRSQISENAGDVAGGVLSLARFSSISVSESTVQGNTAVGGSGGIFADSNDGTAIVSIDASTIAGNSGGSGGGVFVEAGAEADLSILSSTISGNTAVRGGGGVAVKADDGRVEVQYSTLVKNTAGVEAGGLWNLHGSLTLQASIIADNHAPLAADLQPGVQLPDVRYSFIGNNQNTGLSATSAGLADRHGNLIGRPGAPLNPRLGPLADNGGPTLSHAPLAASPVIDAAEALHDKLPVSDQRRAPYQRLFGVRTDMGSIEVQPTPAPDDAVPATSMNLKVSEINYHPGIPTPLEIAAGFDIEGDFEFIELVNVSLDAIDLTGVELQRVLTIDKQTNELTQAGVDFVFASGDITRLEPGEHVLIVENAEAFQFRYGDSLPVAGEWSGQLSDRMEMLTLISRVDTFHMMYQFTYDDHWYPTTDGGGRTLELADRLATDLSQQTAWRASTDLGGSPGVSTGLLLVAGDANGDGIFDSSDLVQVFRAGLYDTNLPADWASGDWNSDGVFDSGDLVLAFQQGNYLS